MNWYLLSRILGQLGILIGCRWSVFPGHFPSWDKPAPFEANGFFGLLISPVAASSDPHWLGRNEQSNILRKEALAIVGLGWLMAGFLGGLPLSLLRNLSRSRSTDDGD
ncbi:MAG: hypothetical protein R3C11_11380 [Planctomycetaceae bacterium]